MGRPALLASLAAAASVAVFVWWTVLGPEHAPRSNGLAPERRAAAPGETSEAAPPVTPPELAAERVDVGSAVEAAPDRAPGPGELVITCDAVRDGSPDADLYEPLHLPGRFRYLPIGPADGRELALESVPDAEGHRSAPLPRGEWLVELRVPGYQPDLERVVMPFWSETEYEYMASIEPGVDIEFDVRLPDGSRPNQALYTFALRDPEESRAAFVPRPEELMTSPTGLWTSEEPRITVVGCDEFNATDLLFAAEPTRGSPYDARAACRYVSRAIAVHPPRPGKVRVDLYAAAELTYTVRRPAAPLIEQRIDVRAVRLDGCEGYDVRALLASSLDIGEWPAELIARDTFAFDSFSLRPEDTDAVTTPYLVPGRWLVVAGWRGEGPSATATVELVAGENEVALELGEPSIAGWVRARFFVDGEPVPVPARDFDIDFALVVAGSSPAACAVDDGGVRSGGGGIWFPRDDLAAAWAGLAAGDGAPVHLVADCRGRGVYVSGPLHLSDAELYLAKHERAMIRIVSARPCPRAITVEVEGHLVEPTPESRLVDAARPVFRWPEERPVRAEIVFGPARQASLQGFSLAPGRWRFDVRLPQRPAVTLPPIELVLGSEPTKLSLELPE